MGPGAASLSMAMVCKLDWRFSFQGSPLSVWCKACTRNLHLHRVVGANFFAFLALFGSLVAHVYSRLLQHFCASLCGLFLGGVELVQSRLDVGFSFPARLPGGSLLVPDGNVSLDLDTPFLFLLHLLTAGFTAIIMITNSREGAPSFI